MNSLSILVAVLVLLAIVVAFGESSRRSARQVRRLTGRLTSVERRLSLVMERVGVEEQPPPAVLRYLDQGNEMGAIAAYRKETGTDLKEARDAVQGIAREHHLDR